MNADIKELNSKSQIYSEKIDKVLEQVQTVIVGQDDTLKKIMISLLADGHVLLEGAPGLAKTLMVKTISDTIKSTFKRLQFTPDLLPADIVGTKIYNHNKETFSTKKGPVFANFILADEINRAPPKVQSALLEAMHEKQVTISGETFILEKPFLVLATQNPIETEGTYRLPEAQVDRFMFKLLITNPNKKDSIEIINRMTTNKTFNIKQILDSKEIVEMQKFTRTIYADEKIEEYIASLIDATHNPKDYKLEVGQYIEYGASPRASIALMLGAKANAILNGRGYVIPEDIVEIAPDVLRHRMILNFEADAEDITTDDLIKQIIEKVKMP